MQPRIEVIVTDENDEVLFRGVSNSVESAIADLGRYERMAAAQRGEEEVI